MNIDLYKFFLSKFNDLNCNENENEIIKFFYENKKTLKNIPDNVTYLDFSNYYKELKPNDISNKITHINFGDIFNKSLTYQITLNDTDFTTNNYVKKIFEISIIPKSVKYIRLGNSFNQKIKVGHIPYGVKHIVFDNNANIKTNIDIGGLPNTITHLELNKLCNSIDKGIIPDSVIDLSIPCFNSSNQVINYNIIPNSVKVLKIRYNTNNIKQIPKSVIKLKLTFDKRDLPNIIITPDCNLPDNIKELIFDDNFNGLIPEGFIPNSVTHLTLGELFNHPLKQGIIPNSVIYLTFGRFFNQLLQPGDIPNSVKYIHLGKSYNQPFLEKTLPKGLMFIGLGQNYNHILDQNTIPKSVIDIHFIRKKIGGIGYQLYSNKMIGYSEPNNNIITYVNDKKNYKKISMENKNLLIDFIINDFNQTIGKIIYKELIEFILNPNRLLNICNIFNVEMYDLIKNYAT